MAALAGRLRRDAGATGADSGETPELRSAAVPGGVPGEAGPPFAWQATEFARQVRRGRTVDGGPAGRLRRDAGATLTLVPSRRGPRICRRACLHAQPL